MKRKALVLDIDGTLTNSKKEITDKTRHAIWSEVSSVDSSPEESD